MSEEEFPDYQKLMDAMAVDPTLFTLPCLLSLAVVPSTSGQKRPRVIPTDGEGDIEHTRAYSSDMHPATEDTGAAVAALLPPQGHTGQEELELSPDLVRANAVTVFVASPLLPEHDKLTADHISSLLALAVDGLAQKAAIKFLALNYS